MRTAKTLIGLCGCQAGLSLRWAHRSFCCFCHEAAHLVLLVYPHFSDFYGS